MTATPEHPLTRLRFNHTPRYPTYASLARAAGLSVAAVRRFEVEPDKYPIGYESACKLAHALDVTVDQLADEIGPQVRKLELPPVKS